MLSNRGCKGFHGGEHECSDGGQEGASGCQEGVEKIVSGRALRRRSRRAACILDFLRSRAGFLACPFKNV